MVGTGISDSFATVDIFHYDYGLISWVKLQFTGILDTDHNLQMTSKLNCSKSKMSCNKLNKGWEKNMTLPGIQASKVGT